VTGVPRQTSKGPLSPLPAQISPPYVGFHLRSQAPCGRASPSEVGRAGRPRRGGFGVSSTEPKSVIGPFCLGFSVASSLAPLLPFARLAGAMQFKQRGTSNQNTTPRQSKNHSRAGLRSHLAACLPPRHCSWEALLERGLQGQHGAGLSRRWTVCSMG